MKRIVTVPDSCKGTLSSKEICDIIRERVGVHFPDAELVSLPVADGGEGSVDCFLSATRGELIKCRAENPFFEQIESFYGLINEGKTAVIEMAACAGTKRPHLPDLRQHFHTYTIGCQVLLQCLPTESLQGECYGYRKVSA